MSNKVKIYFELFIGLAVIYVIFLYIIDYENYFVNKEIPYGLGGKILLLFLKIIDKVGGSIFVISFMILVALFIIFHAIKKILALRDKQNKK